VTLLERVVVLLDERSVPHALVGAAALAAAGVARSTFDVDLLTCDLSVLQTDFWGGLRADGASVDVRRGGSEDPLAGVVRLEQGTERPVDLIVGRHAWQARAVDRALRPAGGPPIVTPCDLVLLKLYAGGTQDLWDIRELLGTAKGERLAAEVERQLQDLPRPMRDRWESLYR
jgi:hypothetical protein